MKESVEKDLFETLEHSYFQKGKVDVSVLNQLFDDRKKEGFDLKTSMVGLIITVDSENVKLEGALARKDNNIAIYTSYSNLVELLENPGVVHLEACNDIVLLKSTNTGEVNLRTPWPGPIGDEWDSPAYNSFWHGAEQEIDKRIKRLESVGIKVKLLPSS
ncbi:MAG TPA: hypothetical protein VMR19_01690 [Candidatus Saccharimonadales bacterium]|jgi:hypothetical protein|nr:hypothetical protein [Candidatus Saccharimonadales bacterium]